MATKKTKRQTHIKNDKVSQSCAEKSLWDSDRFNGYLFETCPIGLALCRLDGTLVKVNPAYAAILGRTVEETGTLTYWEITPIKYASQEKVQLNSLETTGKYGPYEKEYIHKDGHLVPVRLKGLMIEIEGERLIWSSVEDISDRKHLEEELIKQRDFNQTIIDACPAYIFTLDADGKTQMMNPAMLNALGYSLGEVLGTDYIQTFVPEADRAGIYKNKRRLANLGDPSVHLNRVITKTGEVRLVEWHERLVEQYNNSADFMMAVGIDVSDRTSAQKAFFESEQRFRATFEQTAIGLCHVDLNGRWLLVNQRLCDLLGYTRSELLSLSFQDVTHPDDLGADLDYLHQLLAGEIPNYSMEKRYICKNGSQIWIHLTGSLVRNSAGEPKYFIGAISDISDRKALEKELAFKQALFNSFFNTATAGLIIFDEQLRYIQINEAIAQMNGLSIAEHIGKTVREVLPHLAANVEPVFQQILVTGEPLINLEISGETPKEPGIERHWVVSYFPLPDSDGKSLGLGGVVVEISELKRAEAALKKYQEHLEDLVAERTSELSDTNLQLTEKITELEAAQTALRHQAQILDRIHDAVICCDLNGTVISWNKGAERVYGYLESEVIGRNIAFTYAPDELHRMTSEVIGPLLAKGSNEVEMKALHKEGKIIDVHLSLSLLNDRVGNVTGMIGYSMDITDRKQAEAELERSYNLLNSILESTPDFIFIKDLDSCYVMLNSSVARYFGKSIAEITGKKDVDLVELEIAQQLRENDLKIFDSGVTQVLEEIFYENGAITTFLSTKTPWRDLEGNIIGLIGISRDISDRKLAEEALREQTRRNEMILQTTMDGLLKLRLEDGKIIEVNPAFCNIIGYLPEELLEMKVSDLNVIESQTEIAARMQSIVDNKFARFHTRHRRKDGEIVDIEVSANYVEMGAEKFIFSFVRDITDRKLAEEALQESEKVLRQKVMREALLNSLAKQIRNSLDINTILGTAVQEIRHLLQIDWCIFGWYYPSQNPPIWAGLYESKNPDLPTLIGSYPIDLESPSVKQTLQLQVIQIDDVRTISEPSLRDIYLAVNIMSSLSVPIQPQSGDIGLIGCNALELRCWSESEVELLKAVGDQLAIAIEQAQLYEQTRIAATQAQAQAQQLEETLQQLQRTQTQLIQTEKMSSLGQLVAGVAHEINNPVNFIYGNLNPANQYIQDLLNLVEIYQENYPNPAPEIQAEIEAIELDFLREDLPKLMSSMKLGADRIREIVLSLRTFSRLDEADMKEVDIHEGLDSTLLILQNRLKVKSERTAIQVIKEYGNLPKVECYPGQLNQVFMNVIANAIDALEEYHKKNPTVDFKTNPGTITIRTQVIGNQQKNNNGKVVICIADNGPGMPEAVRKRLFDPFFTTKPVGKGTGLGLAISYQIVVEKHQGNITCNSVLGKGSEFAIEIPIRQA